VETFALIREPLDWLGSWYRYRSRDDLVGHENSTRDVSFSEFVTEWLGDAPAPFAKIGSQANFVTDKVGKVGVDHLFRYEAPQKYLSFLGARLARDILPKQCNVSPKMDLVLDSALKTRLLADKQRDFEIWENATH
jgi:hypothetical protein